jgi:hypothetical protein
LVENNLAFKRENLPAEALDDKAAQALRRNGMQMFELDY